MTTVTLNIKDESKAGDVLRFLRDIDFLEVLEPAQKQVASGAIDSLIEELLNNPLVVTGFTASVFQGLEPKNTKIIEGLTPDQGADNLLTSSPTPTARLTLIFLTSPTLPLSHQAMTWLSRLMWKTHGAPQAQVLSDISA